MVTQISIPIYDVLLFENMDERIRQEASEDFGVSLGNGDGEYPWQIEDFWRDGGTNCIVFEIYAESNDPVKNPTKGLRYN
jgi:hypothetical protein